MNDNNNDNNNKQPTNFETSFARLETILEKLNSGTVSLDESLKLYEEANTLIMSCNSCLTDAEQKIAVLVKNRQGEVQVEPTGQPVTQEFPSV